MKFLLLSCFLLGVMVGTAHLDCTPKFKQEFLAKHNEFRAKHGVPPLTLDSTVGAVAQEWANHIASTGQYGHRPGCKYGETIHWWPEVIPTGGAEAQLFYDGIKYYHYFGHEPDQSNFFKWGAFTQVVWKATQKLGVGCATAGDKFYLVANYDPSGNYEGEYAANVLPPH